MTDPIDHQAATAQPPPGHRPATAQPPPGPGVSQPAPVVAWATVPAAGAGTVAPRRLLDVVIWVVALAALVFLSLIRAGLAGTTGSERIGYSIGGIAFGLLVSAAVRWLWLRARRRNDPTARLLSPWIPIGAVILVIFSMFGSSRS